MSEAIELLTKLDEKVQAKMDTVTAEVKEYGKASKSANEELKASLDEWKDVKQDVDKIRQDVLDLKQRGFVGIEDKPKIKTLGQEVVGSEGFKSFHSGQTSKTRIECKNTIVNSGNDTSRHDQLAGVVEGAFRALTVMPTVDTVQASSNVIYYSRELAWTNNAAGQTEGSAKAESDLTFEELTTPIQTIAHFLKVSRQSLDDSTFLASYIDRRMGHGVMNKTESQIVNGDGTGNNFSGWLATGNSTATSATGTTDIYGLTNRMKYDVIAADYMPDFFYFNPQDWSTMETERRGTGDNAFVGASGAVSYTDNGKTPLLWGLPVVVSNNIPQGIVICKSRDADAYADRQSVTVEMFEQDGTNVQSNLVTVRGENRGAALNFVPAAIRTGTIANITDPA